MEKTISTQFDKFGIAILLGLFWPAAALLGAGMATLPAAPVHLMWEAAGDPSVQGYAIYYGLTNQPATNHIDTGTNRTVTVFNLLAEASYQFYAVSYNAAGVESGPSNPLLVQPPVLSGLRIAASVPPRLHLALRAAPGSVCQIEYADDFVNGTWRILGMGTANANGDLAVLDDANPQFPSRFYRAARLANPPPFTRLQLVMEADGLLQLKLSGSPGTAWGLQSAPIDGTAPWTTFASVTANGIGEAAANLLGETGGVARVYRAELK